MHKNKPCLNADFPFLKSFSESASATNGVIAVENPIPKDMAINNQVIDELGAKIK